MSLPGKSRKGSARKPGQASDWSFGKEADYAEDGTSRWELGAALALVTVWVVLGFRADGLGPAIKTFSFYILPLAGIWKLEVMGSVGLRLNPFLRTNQQTPAHVVRVCSWLWLCFPLFVNGFALLFKWQGK